MHKIIIFGNSGSGKSTLASKLSRYGGIALLDLDTIAWSASNPTERAPLDLTWQKLKRFIDDHSEWVIEGCYADLLELVSPFANQLFYLDLPVADCISNAKMRPWEPHKYLSKEAQDGNLPMLLEWISQYPERTDTFSQRAHENLYDAFTKKKTMIVSNLEETDCDSIFRAE